MIGFLVLVTFEGVPPPDSAKDLVHEELSGGFLGASVWVGLGESATAVSMIHFTDREAADEHLRERVERSSAPPRALRFPPTIRHLELAEAHGGSLESAPVGSYVSLFHVLADPGYGNDIGREVEETLQSIALLDGYAGHLRGFDVSLEDEVWGIAFWSSPPVLPTAPDRQDASVEHYRRLR